MNNFLKTNQSMDLQSVQKSILECLYNQKNHIEENFIGEELENLIHGIYMQASLADEMFLDTNLNNEWKENMLEHKLFNTQNAGVVIPEKMVQIIQHPERYAREFIELNYTVLSLGFKGGLNEKTSYNLKNRFLSILYPSDMFLEKQEKIFSDSDFLIAKSDSNFRLMSKLSKINWTSSFVVFLSIFVVVTTYSWYFHTKSIDTQIKSIK